MQISGGNRVKQGDFGSTFTYKLADEKNHELDVFDQKTAYVNLVLNNNIIFTTTTIVDGSKVTFNIDKVIPTGLYFLEIKVDSYIFPSDRETIILVTAGAVAYDLKDLVPDHDADMAISEILSDLSQKGIDITDLRSRIDATTAQLAQNTSQLNDIAYNAKSETGANDSEKINKALTKGNTHVPEGTYNITAVLKLLDARKLTGAGVDKTILLVDNLTTLKGVIDVDGKKNCYISDLTIKSTDNKTSCGIFVRGNSDNVILERVKTEGFGEGVKCEGSEGTTPGTIKNLTLRNVTTTHTTTPTGGSYGICLGDVDGAVIDNCFSSYNYIDGIKLRKRNNNINIIGGMSVFNGQSGTNGDGLDGYAGSHNISINGLICNNNFANGIYIKTGGLNTSDSPNYGYINNVSLVNCMSFNNGGNGLEINRNSGATDTEVLVQNVNIISGYYNNNSGSGLVVRGRNIKIIGTVAKHNSVYGCNISQSSYDVELSGVDFSHNYLGGGAESCGLIISGGKKVRVISATIYGKDSDNVKTTTDLDALTATHQHGIIIRSSSDEVYVSRDVDINYNSTTLKILSQMTTGILLIDHVGQSAPENNVYGGPGSTYTRTNGNHILLTQYVKTSGLGVTGWTNVTRQALTQANSTAADVATLKTDFNNLLSKLKTAGLMQ